MGTGPPKLPCCPGVGVGNWGAPDSALKIAGRSQNLGERVVSHSRLILRFLPGDAQAGEAGLPCPTGHLHLVQAALVDVVVVVLVRRNPLVLPLLRVEGRHQAQVVHPLPRRGAESA